MTRCDVCDHPLATNADLFGCEGGCRCERCTQLCWRDYNLACSFEPVDWRARALTAEAEVERLRPVVEAAADWNRADAGGDEHDRLVLAVNTYHAGKAAS